MKMMAKELEIPVLLLSQLNRRVDRTEKNESDEPVLSDLRESGAIEQDADIVMFLDRSLSQMEANQEDRPTLGTADVIVAKHRNGPIGEVHLAFNPNWTRFDNLSWDRNAQQAQPQGHPQGQPQGR